MNELIVKQLFAEKSFCLFSSDKNQSSKTMIFLPKYGLRRILRPGHIA